MSVILELGGVEERRIQVWDHPKLHWSCLRKKNLALLLWWFSGTQWDATCLHLSKLVSSSKTACLSSTKCLWKRYHQYFSNCFTEREGTLLNSFYEASVWYQNQITKRENEKPISLMNIVVEILKKIVANWIQEHIIYHNQVAFNPRDATWVKYMQINKCSIPYEYS